VTVDLIETAKWAVPALMGSGGVWAWLRQTQRKSSASQITKSQADLVTAVNTQTATILEENARLRREGNRDRRALKRRVDNLEREVQECQGHKQDCEESLQEFRNELARYMRDNPPAEYMEIKRVD
jgi:chromosome segregation ATPase